MSSLEQNMLFLVSSCLLLSLFTTIQASPENAKRQIERHWNSTQDELRAALGKVDWFVLHRPLTKLKDLAEAGKKDINYISSFQGPGDKKKAYAISVLFWKEKMQEVIEPYVENPSLYQGLMVDPIFAPEDPKWNNTNAYKKAEREIVREVEKATKKLNEEVTKTIKPRAHNVVEVTEDSWRELMSSMALKEKVTGIQRAGQWAKADAAGGKSESGMKKLREAIENTLKDLKQRLQEINASSE